MHPLISALQVIYVLGLLWNMLEEAREMIHLKRSAGSVLSYFENAWNWVYITSLCVQWVGVGMW